MSKLIYIRIKNPGTKVMSRMDKNNIIYNIYSYECFALISASASIILPLFFLFIL